MTYLPRTRFGVTAKAPFILLALGLMVTLAASSADAASRHHHRGRAIPAGLTDPEKDAALIVDGETGKPLYARNASAERHPASLTKMMTLYLLFEALKKGQMTMETAMPVSEHASAQKPTKLHLQPGDTIPVETAIKAIVVRSANDVAVTIAESLGGTEPHFAQMMTAKARQLGMKDTFFHNASGLPDPMQITTANDLAVLARHLAYDYPQYFHYFGTPGFSYRGVYYPTHDNLIGNYDGADGIKTGYTEASGFNLVSSVVRGGTHVIGVVMGGRTAHRRDHEMVRLLDDAFAQIAKNPTLVARAQVPWQSMAQNAAPVVAGFSLAPQTAQQTAQAEPDDEDAAEAQSDDDDAGVKNLIAPAPKPQPATVVAAYQPRPVATPKPVLRPETGEGDISDDEVTAPAKLGKQDWTVQIGAFADIKIAREQLATYAEKSMDVLGRAARLVIPFQSVDGHTLYRARFGPFVEREAREVCSRLTERGQTCFAAIAAN
jgi:D-alanyl-D-alanine carboxypeptidase